MVLAALVLAQPTKVPALLVLLATGHDSSADVGLERIPATAQIRHPMSADIFRWLTLETNRYSVRASFLGKSLARTRRVV
jgi:hypothetical protein